MSKKLLFIVGASALLFLGKPTLPIYASEVEPSSEVVITEEEEVITLPEIVQEQLDQLESIIVALFASFVGTGTVAMIIRIALSRLTKQMTKKVTDAEAQNKLSSKQAQDAIATIVAFETVLKGQVVALESTIIDLIRNQEITNENIKLMLDEYTARDAQVKDLIIKEFGDELNE